MSTKTVDWGVLDLPNVKAVIEQATRAAHRLYENVIELDDLMQEATIMVVTRQNLVSAAEEPGLLQHRLEQDLGDYLLPRAKRAEKTVSYEEVTQGDDEHYQLPYVVIETASNDYTRESVETLLPAVWDESYLYGLPQRDDAPDPDMPKGATNKARGNNLAAYIADIKTGWEETPLTDKERRALILAYGIGWSQRQIAYNQGVSQPAIKKRIEQGIGKIVARLNGGYWYELEGIEV